jgi:DNA ligase-associated metallophosphoesterase
LPQKALFLPQFYTLVISDVHLGKSAHFRKNGIPLTEAPQHQDLQNIQNLIDSCSPSTVIFLGDLFHSTYNESWLQFKLFVASNPEVEFILIKGNHDMLVESRYVEAGIRLMSAMQIESKILFSHEPSNNGLFNVHGHLHPAIRLTGKGRQKLVLPCFWKGKKHLAMPGFGKTTGLFTVKPLPGDQVFAITAQSVVPYLQK